MINEGHRMIYYEPDDDEPDLGHGALDSLGNGTLRVEFGNLGILVDPWPVSAGQTRRSSRWPLDAILVPRLEETTAGPAYPGALDRDIPAIAPPDLIDSLAKHEFTNLHPLDTWRWIVLRKGNASVTITALPGRHPSRAGAALMGCMLEFRGYPDAEPYRLYLSGGTAFGNDLYEIPARYPRVDLAVIELSSIELADSVVAFDVGQAIEVLGAVRPAMVIPVHRLHNTFTWPVRDFQQALRRHPVPCCMRRVASGDRHVFTIPAQREQVAPALSPGPIVAAGRLTVHRDDLAGTIRISGQRESPRLEDDLPSTALTPGLFASRVPERTHSG